MSSIDIELQQNIFDKLVQIPSYYFNKPNFQMYLKAISLEIEEIYQAIYDLRYKRSVDTAEGINLDYIGEIVGEPRAYDLSLNAGYFTFDETSFSDTGFDLGKFISLNESENVQVTREDEIYRKAIKTKIFKNMGYATPEEIISLTKTMTGANTIVFQQDYPAGCSIYYDIEIDSVERNYFYNFIQSSLPAGVKLNNFATYYLLQDNDENSIQDNNENDLISS